jgi:monoterpene epsilon-lactone hydrolase
LRVGDYSVPVLWVQGPNASKTGVILYFHGGAYVFGSPGTHSAMLAGLSLLNGMVACLPAYRLVPEHAFPAAIEGGVTSYLAPLRCGFASKDIVIGGNSTGGGLAPAVLGQI